MNVFLTWTQLKAQVKNKAKLRFVERDSFYNLEYPDDVGIFEASILKDAGADQTDFETNYKSYANKPYNNLTPAQGVPMVAVYKQEGTSGTIISYDWTKKQTWYEKSVRVTGETLTLDSGLVYNSAHTFWIDLNHGFLTDEDDIKAPYLPKVYDNGVQLVEDTDFTVDYVTGKVTLLASPVGAITADYSYATQSTFTLAPASGKILMIDHTELQFTTDLMFPGSYIDFDIYVYNPYDLPNKVLYKKKRYKSIRDIVSGANLGQGFIPAVAGFSNDVVVLPFNYVTTQPLDSRVGAEIRVSINNHVPFSGEFATVTFYVHSVEAI